MPAWNELLNEYLSQPDEEKGTWLQTKIVDNLQEIGVQRGGRNVILYSSAFLQKPQIPPQLLQITHEEVNGFMSVMYGMDWDKHLTLVLHTPGGVTNATETLVDYLCSKFSDIEVIIPTYAMSAGTMISLASNRIIMGRQSQLGPIDPQMPIQGTVISARAVVDQFLTAKVEILGDPTTGVVGDLRAAHVWVPILQTLGPALLQEAQYALDYSKTMVKRWLENRMFTKHQNASQMAADTAKHFNDASNHKSHGRRIDREEARSKNVVVEDLEDNQHLQESVLSAYHLMTIMFEQTLAAKFLASNSNRYWIKNG